MAHSIFNTFIHPEATAKVSRMLATTYISEGDLVKEFEGELHAKFGIINPIALNSGTTALHLALIEAGIKEGDEVILPAQTFVATGLVVLQQKAVPVFADIQYNTGNIDPEAIKRAITNKTKAIMVVHWAGYPCDMDEIMEIARVNNLVVIEDAALALGADYKGHSIGSISDYTCFSFQAIKHLTTADGGALSCKENNKFHHAMASRWFGIDRSNSMPGFLGERIYNISFIGYKYHMNDYAAALGLANMMGFEERMIQRRKIAHYYRQELAKVDGISLFDNNSDRNSAFWLFGLHIKQRDNFVTALKERGVVASVVHQRIDRNSVFGGLKKHLENQALFDATQVHIPIHDAIGETEAGFIVDCIKMGW